MISCINYIKSNKRKNTSKQQTNELGYHKLSLHRNPRLAAWHSNFVILTKGKVKTIAKQNKTKKKSYTKKQKKLTTDETTKKENRQGEKH